MNSLIHERSSNAQRINNFGAGRGVARKNFQGGLTPNGSKIKARQRRAQKFANFLDEMINLLVYNY